MEQTSGSARRMHVAIRGNSHVARLFSLLLSSPSPVPVVQWCANAWSRLNFRASSQESGGGGGGGDEDGVARSFHFILCTDLLVFASARVSTRSRTSTDGGATRQSCRPPLSSSRRDWRRSSAVRPRSVTTLPVDPHPLLFVSRATHKAAPEATSQPPRETSGSVSAHR